MKTLIVPRRFCGPTGTANGGYICGAIAALAPYSVTVRLIKPAPVETELLVVERDGLVEAYDGEHVVAQARRGDVGDLVPPASPGFQAALEASRHYAGHFRPHPAPSCFVCGPEREPGDALCIYPGAVAGGLVASPWTPDPSLDGGDGHVEPRFMWAALDCPGYVAVAEDLRPMLLGELTAHVHRRAAIGEPCVAIGWPIGAPDGRKHAAGTAVFGADGRPCGLARAVWIEPRDTRT